MNFDGANTDGHVKLDDKDFFPTTKFDKYGNETALISSAFRTYYKIQGFFKDSTRDSRTFQDGGWNSRAFQVFTNHIWLNQSLDALCCLLFSVDSSEKSGTVAPLETPAWEAR